MALFPETISIDDDVNGENTNCPSSIVSQFAEPSRLLKTAILDLLSFKDQLEDAANDIPLLIRSLQDADPAVVSRAAHLVYLLSKEDKCIATLASNENLIGALVNAIGSGNEDTKRDAAAVLSHISNDSIGRMHIFRSGGIAELVRMLQSNFDIVVHYAVTTLHNLLLFIEQAKNEIIACGGLEAFVPHLGSRNAKLQALVADCLYFLLLDQPQCKQTFLSLQGPRYLIAILRSNPSYVKLVYAVVRCIRSISTDPQNKASLISMGGLEALHHTIGSIYDEKRKLAVLNAMRNLSDFATNLDTLGDLVIYLIKLVGEQRDEEIISCACGILSNLTCNNICNKQAVCSNGGILALVKILEEYRMMEEITEPALCTLRHCTVRHALALQAQDQLQFGHAIILTLLATRRGSIVKAALGLVRNCALSQINLQSILSKRTPEGDTVATLALETLQEFGTLLHEDYNGLSDVKDGVSLLEMVEGAISAMHQLAKDPLVAKSVYNDQSSMNVLMNLLANEQIRTNHQDEYLMREIMGLIYQLTKSPDGVKSVQMFGPQAYISDALHSPHQSIAAYASIILKNLAMMNKSSEFNSQRFGVQEYDYLHSVGNGSDTMGSRVHQNGAEMGWLNDGMEPELFNELRTLDDMSKNDRIEGNAQNGGSWYDTDL